MLTAGRDRPWDLDRRAREVAAWAGPGAVLQAEVKGGVVGVILDGRGRPLQLAAGPEERSAQLRRWHAALALYAQEAA